MLHQYLMRAAIWPSPPKASPQGEAQGRAKTPLTQKPSLLRLHLWLVPNVRHGVNRDECVRIFLVHVGHQLLVFVFVHDGDDLAALLQVVCAYRLFMPFASITVSTRECARVRDNLMNIAATKISAGVSTGIGSHSEDIEEKDRGDEQFEISDGRDVKQVYDDLVKIGLQPVMSDYIYCG